MKLFNAARSKTLLAVVPALAAMALSGVVAAQPSKPHGVLPPQLCFAVYPAPVQPMLCGQGDGNKPA